VGGHQLERTQKNAARPQWGWSGVREIVPPQWSEAELRRVAGLLPSRHSSIENIVAELHVIGGRYHRNLHQDEFGPTRAERMQALRDNRVEGAAAISDLPQSHSITAAQLLHVNLPQCSPLKKGGLLLHGGQLTARLLRHRCPAAQSVRK
jgi:hypothetical protein